MPRMPITVYTRGAWEGMGCQKKPTARGIACLVRVNYFCLKTVHPMSVFNLLKAKTQISLKNRNLLKTGSCYQRVLGNNYTELCYQCTLTKWFGRTLRCAKTDFTNSITFSNAGYNISQGLKCKYRLVVIFSPQVNLRQWRTDVLGTVAGFLSNLRVLLSPSLFWPFTYSSTSPPSPRQCWKDLSEHRHLFCLCNVCSTHPVQHCLGGRGELLRSLLL